MSSRLFDLAALGGIFLLAALSTAYVANPALAELASEPNIAVVIGAAAGVGGVIALMSTSVLDPLMDLLMDPFPRGDEPGAFPRGPGGMVSSVVERDSIRIRRLRASYVLYTKAGDALRTQVEALRDSAQASLTGAIAVGVGVVVGIVGASPGEEPSVYLVVAAWFFLSFFAAATGINQVIHARGLLRLFLAEVGESMSMSDFSEEANPPN